MPEAKYTEAYNEAKNGGAECTAGNLDRDGLREETLQRRQMHILRREVAMCINTITPAKCAQFMKHVMLYMSAEDIFVSYFVMSFWNPKWNYFDRIWSSHFVFIFNSSELKSRLTK